MDPPVRRRSMQCIEASRKNPAHSIDARTVFMHGADERCNCGACNAIYLPGRWLRMRESHRNIPACSSLIEAQVDRNKRELSRDMQNATDYVSWRGAAEALDQIEGRDDWRDDDTSNDYDW